MGACFGQPQIAQAYARTILRRFLKKLGRFDRQRRLDDEKSFSAPHFESLTLHIGNETLELQP